MSTRRNGHRIAALTATVVGMLLATSASSGALARPAAPAGVTADLDGKPIPLVEVGSHYCHDFDFPRIHCFETEEGLTTRAEAIIAAAAEAAAARSTAASTEASAAAAATTYVRIFENPLWGGATMYVSQDISVLAWYGWNDRISSFIATTSDGGSFFTDWYYFGTRYGFCCFQNPTSLGSFNDTFSSVHRT